MPASQAAITDQSWTSRGLSPVEALGHWQRWVSSTLAPNEIEIADSDAFSAHWESQPVGPLQLLTFEASPQRVVHRGVDRAGAGDRTFQLVYSRQGTFETRVRGARFAVNPGEFVLLDNAEPYEMQMESAHAAIDLLMPSSWLERHIPDHLHFLGRSVSASCRWGLPLGSLLTTMSTELSEAPAPRGLLADQVSSLLSLALSELPVPTSRHRCKIARRIQQSVADRHAEAELTPADVATALGISKRYLHALLAEQGATFVSTLNGVRLDRAAEMLADPRLRGLQIAEIAWRCGYFDANYCARLFGRRFGMSPRAWRARHLS